MRILLTGITGQIGRALLQPLGEIGTVLPAGRSALDLARPDAIGPALDRFAPDLIVNPAAYTAVDPAEDQRDLAFAVNAEAPGCIAAWAAAHRVPVIHFSTDYVFDGSGERPWLETDVPAPLSVYGTSKLAGDRAIAGSGCRHLIVRTSWVYDACGNNFLRTIARLARERSEFTVVDDQFGAPTPARVAADIVVKILQRECSDWPHAFDRTGGLININASGVTSRHGFATAIVSGLRKRGVRLAAASVLPVKSRDLPAKARRPLNCQLGLHRLAEVFGIVPPVWSDALDIELDELARELVSP